MEDFELTLFDRIETIKQVYQQHDLENNAYISFSGGKDSVVLHHLIDMAIPNNKIPRVFINTGIEYLDIVNYVKEMASADDRFVIINPSQPIKMMLEKYGYPFKSKQHSHNLGIFWNNKDKAEYTLTNQKYLGIIESSTKFKCPTILKYQFTKEFKIKCSDNCCLKLKKEPFKKYQKENNKSITITGMRKAEGGQRASLKGCIIIDKEKNVVKFHPLLIVSDEFENWFIDKHNVKLCKLYYPPFNFKRTGCKGCPFSLDLQQQLDVMEIYLPNEKKQCEMIWKPIYEEYRKLGFRLKKKKQYEQLTLFDCVKE